ncbi:hypothetical protein QJQ45_028651, partial [Haematococcus lacustris]
MTSLKRPFQEMEQQGEQEGLPVIVKLICPVDRTGSIIGKGGEVIRQIRQETGAKVKVEDVVTGHPDRAVTISAPDRLGQASCGTQDAIQRLMSRVLEVDGLDGRPVIPEQATVQLIVDRGFIGTIVGRAGASVNGIKNDCGVTLHINPPIPSPLVAPEEQICKISGPYPGLKKAVHLLLERVREALQRGTVPAALKAGGMGMGMGPGGMGMGMGMGPGGMGAGGMGAGGMGPGGMGPGGMGPGGMMGMPPPPMGVGPPPGHMGMGMGMGMGPPGMFGMGLPGGPPPGGPGGGPPFTVETVLRVLMTDSRVGGLIGKGGEHLKRIRLATGAEVHVDHKQPGSDDRVITCRSTEMSDAPQVGAVEAFIRCCQFIVTDKGPPDVKEEGGPAAANAPKLLRVLTAPRQLGAVIGVKGATIKQVAADTRARLSVAQVQLAQGVGGPGDEVLHIEGPMPCVLEAARVVAGLLHGIILRSAAEARGLPPPGMNGGNMGMGMSSMGGMGGMMGSMGMSMAAAQQYGATAPQGAANSYAQGYGGQQPPQQQQQQPAPHTMPQQYGGYLPPAANPAYPNTYAQIAPLQQQQQQQQQQASGLGSGQTAPSAAPHPQQQHSYSSYQQGPAATPQTYPSHYPSHQQQQQQAPNCSSSSSSTGRAWLPPPPTPKPRRCGRWRCCGHWLPPAPTDPTAHYYAGYQQQQQQQPGQQPGGAGAVQSGFGGGAGGSNAPYSTANNSYGYPQAAAAPPAAAAGDPYGHTGSMGPYGQQQQGGQQKAGYGVGSEGQVAGGGGGSGYGAGAVPGGAAGSQSLSFAAAGGAYSAPAYPAQQQYQQQQQQQQAGAVQAAGGYGAGYGAQPAVTQPAAAVQQQQQGGGWGGCSGAGGHPVSGAQVAVLGTVLAGGEKEIEIVGTHDAAMAAYNHISVKRAVRGSSALEPAPEGSVASAQPTSPLQPPRPAPLSSPPPSAPTTPPCPSHRSAPSP